jgi:hypothetical protein
MCRASRNLGDVRTVTPGSLCLLDVLKYRHLVLTRPAAEALTTQLLAEIRRGSKRHTGEAATAGAPETTVEMDNTVEEKREAGTPSDVAVAEGAEAVATPRAVEAAAEDASAAASSEGASSEGASSEAPRATRSRRTRASAEASETAGAESSADSSEEDS